jgi:hypothetical protein
MSGNTSLVSSTPGFVTGTYGAKDVRLATLGNTLPGLFASGDFAVSQRAAGANMSVDIAQGRACVDPGGTHQGIYLARRTSATAYNTSADGGYTWTAADATNPRIDLLCIEAKDTDEDASGVTGWRFRIVDGTPSASATHQLETAAWPAVPTGCLPITAIRVPAAATTLTTANITNLNPIAGGRGSALYTATAETTTSTSYTRLTTPDLAFVYVPNSSARLRVGYKAHWKVSVASGTQTVALFLNSQQLRYGAAAAAAAVQEYAVTSLTTSYSHLTTDGGNSASLGFIYGSGGADVSDVSTGQVMSYNAAGEMGAPLEIFGLAAGWYTVEVKFKTSANTLSVRERHLWAEVIG